MRKMMLITAFAPLALAVAAVPAMAETTVVKTVRHDGMGGRSKKVVIKRHMGGTTVKKVIRHDD